MIVRRSANASGQAMSFGRSKAKFQMEAKTGIQFDDVAGIEEQKKNYRKSLPSSRSQKNLPLLEQKFPVEYY